MPTEEGLKIKIGADTKDYEEATDKMVNNTQNMAGKIMKIIAGLALIDFVKETANVFKDSARQVALFQSAMEQLGVPQETIDSLKEFSDAAQEAYGIDNDAILGAIANLARLTGSVDAVNALRSSILDMSIATGQSVESVSKILARSLTIGLSSLRRYGIVATEEQQEMWDSFGDDMEAKAEFLNDLLENKFGGAAKKFGDSAAGAAERAKFAFEDMKKSLGAVVLPIMTGFLNLILQIATAVGGLTNLIAILGTVWLGAAIAFKVAAILMGKEVDGLIIKFIALGLARLWAINPLLAIAAGAAFVAAIIGIIYGLGALISNIPMPTTTGGMDEDTQKTANNNQDKDVSKDTKQPIINEIEINQDNLGDYNVRTRNINGTQTNIYRK